MSLRRVVCLVALFLGMGGALSADGYRLVAGDRVEILHAGLATPKTLLVDADGQVRLTDVGGVAVAGLTLDDARDALSAALSAAALYVEPRVSLVMLDYAPVIVAGDVQSPGPVAFHPGLTVAAAAAMAGGGRIAGITRSELMRARAEAASNRTIANTDIAAAVVRLARLRAALDDTPVTLPLSLGARVPSPAAAGLETLLENERAILDTARGQRDALLQFWDQEITTISEQMALFDARIAVQKDIVESTAGVLENARALQERGMQTATRMAAVEQRAADAQSRVLELEWAKIAAAGAVADARRARVQYLSNWTDEALRGIQDATVTLAAAEARHERFATQLQMLAGDTLPGSDSVVYQYSVLSSRPAGGSDTAAADRRLLPGDTLIVRMTPLISETDG